MKDKGISDIKMHIYEAKLLKNGNLSAGQELYQDDIRIGPLNIFRPFITERYSSYYGSSFIQFTFQTAPEMFIRLITETIFPISTLDNEPIHIEK